MRSRAATKVLVRYTRLRQRRPAPPRAPLVLVTDRTTTSSSGKRQYAIPEAAAALKPALRK